MSSAAGRRYAVWPAPRSRSRSRMTESCEDGRFQSPLSSASMDVMLNYDTSKQYLNFDWTDFLLFGVTWPSNLGCCTFGKRIFSSYDESTGSAVWGVLLLLLWHRQTDRHDTLSWLAWLMLSVCHDHFTDWYATCSTEFFVTYAQILRYNNYNKLSFNKSSKSQWILLWHLLLCVITSLYCSLKSTEFNAVCCRGKHLDCSGRFASEDWNYLTVKFTTRGQIIVAQRHDERGKTQQTSAAILKVFRSPCFSAKSTTSDEIWSTWPKILKFKMADNAFWGVGLLFFGHNWSREYCSLSAMTQNQTLKMITGQNYCQISQFNVACWGRGYFTVMSTEFDDVCRAWLNLIVMFLRLKLTILTI